MWAWFDGSAEASALNAAVASIDGYELRLDNNKDGRQPYIRRSTIVATIGAFALSAAAANGLALHPPQDHSGVVDPTLTYTSKGPPKGALRLQPRSSHADGDLLGAFAVAASTEVPQQATSLAPPRGVLRRDPPRKASGEVGPIPVGDRKSVV